MRGENNLMIDLMNSLQIGTSQGELAKLTKGTSIEGMENSSQFQDLLQQLQSTGKEVSPEHLQTLMKQKSEVSPMISKVINQQNNADILADKLLGKATTGEMTPEQMAKVSEGLPLDGQEAETLLEKVQGKVEAQVETQLVPEQNPKSTKLENVVAKNQFDQKSLFGTQVKGEVAQQSVTKETMAKSEMIDPRFGSQLRMNPKAERQNSKLSQSNSTTQLQFSEDFVNTKVNGKLPKGRTIGKKSGLNLFQQEQSVLDNSGIIRKKTLSNLNTEKTSFDSLAKENVSSQFDNVQSVKQEVLAPQFSHDKSGISKIAEASINIASGSDVKVLDMTNIQSSQKLVEEISNYIENTRIQNGKEVEMIVKHNELGQFKINAQKAQGDMIDLKIMTSTDEAQKFFQANETSLLKTLSSQGVRVADFKLSAGDSGSMNSSGNDSSGQNSSGNQQGFAGKFNGGQNFRDGGRERRNQLWENYRERLGA